MNREACHATVHGVAKELDRTEHLCAHVCVHVNEI